MSFELNRLAVEKALPTEASRTHPQGFQLREKTLPVESLTHVVDYLVSQKRGTKSEKAARDSAVKRLMKLMRDVQNENFTPTQDRSQAWAVNRLYSVLNAAEVWKAATKTPED